MAESRSSQVTGDDIISELIRNVDVGLFKVRYTVLLPCRFNVYLHPQDFDVISPLAPVVRREAKQALTDHLERLNKTRKQPKFVKRLGLPVSENKPQYKILENDWNLDFHRGEEDRLRPGEIEIYSDLGTEPRLEEGVGAKTTFVTRHRPEDSSFGVAKDHSIDPQPVFATLRYTDDRGEKVFAITRPETVVGRGGKAVWVDLKLDGPADISREHCRIRRDASTGNFFIQDLSRYGTAVNGTPIPSGADRNQQGPTVDRDGEVPLPSGVKIALADVIVLEFETRPIE